MDDMLPEFLLETSENVSAIETSLVILEKTPNDLDVLKTIFRAMHTIKGNCGMFGFSRLEHVAHAAEDVLVQLRDGTLKISSQAISAILKAIDVIKAIVADLERTRTEPSGDDSAVIQDLKALLPLKTTCEKPTIEIPQQPLVAPTPPPTPEIVVTTQTLPLGTAITAPTHTTNSENKAEHSKSPVTEQASLRVHIGILDTLMNLVGELVLNRNQLLQLAGVDDESPFNKPVAQLNRVTSGLQEAVMKTRMQPIGHAWSKLPRIVRDLEQSTGKKLELLMLGQETEIDRQILQAIQDPLVHCVRNSADHGIEDPQTRLAAGKDKTGKITLKAYQEGGHILIDIEDDGAGIKTNIIRNKAIERGLVGKEQAAKLSDPQVWRFIFEPGFSTAKQVTEVSGRGVGMDVVRNNIEGIGGSIDLASKEGLGATIRIKIPLTLAIISALLVKVGEGPGSIFAIAQVVVVELVHLSENHRHLVDDIHGSKVLRLREKLLPLVDLSVVLGVQKPLAQSTPQKDLCWSVVVVQVAEMQLGLIVDEIFDTQEIVVKPLGKLLRDINLFSGSTILGDGQVVIILDLARIAAAMLPQNTATLIQEKEDKSLFAATDDKVSLLLFRAKEDNSHLAVPLALISRLEEFPLAQLEQVDDHYVVQYRGSLLPLIPVTADISPQICKEGRISAIIFSDKKHTMGLWVYDFIDITEESLKIETTSHSPGFLGGAIVANKATELIDAYHYLKLAYEDWFSVGSFGENKKVSILLVEDSHFFRNLLTPILESNGYQVSQANDGQEALHALQEMPHVDLVLSDIEMPHMDGFELIEKIRAHNDWKDIPCLALTTLANPSHRQKGLNLGFNDYMIKFDQEVVLETIAKTLRQQSNYGSSL